MYMYLYVYMYVYMYIRTYGHPHVIFQEDRLAFPSDDLHALLGLPAKAKQRPFS